MYNYLFPLLLHKCGENITMLDEGVAWGPGGVREIEPMSPNVIIV